MPHAAVAASERLALHDVIEIGRDGDVPVLRVHRLESGDAVVITAVEATRDGVPLLGNLGVVGWGAGALIRAGRLRVDIVWQATGARRAADAGCRCRVCFGSFATTEIAVSCPCEAVFHEDCDAVRVNCPACGSPREEADG